MHGTLATRKGTLGNAFPLVIAILKEENSTRKENRFVIRSNWQFSHNKMHSIGCSDQAIQHMEKQEHETTEDKHHDTVLALYGPGMDN